MRREAVQTLDGGTIEKLVPENDEDRRELDRMAERGEVDLGGFEEFLHPTPEDDEDDPLADEDEEDEDEAER